MRFSDLNGVNNAFTESTWVPNLQDLSIGWVRMGHDLSWQSLEPTRGQWSFAPVDAKVLQLQAAGFRLLPILCYTADWAAGPKGIFGPAQDPRDWENYVRTVVSRYIAPPYNIKFWQIWNEPTREATFWQGETNLAFIDQIYLPAARIIRELGGYAVFGGWPISNSVAELETELNYQDAWKWTDYISIHYSPTSRMRTLVTNWVGTRKVKGLWQTEIGWLKTQGIVPNLYPRILRWALVSDTDTIKLFWYASWSAGTDDGRSFMNGPFESPVVCEPHGVRLRTLARLLSGGPLQPRSDVVSSPAITFNLDEALNSIEAFSVAGRTVVVMHVYTSSVTPTFKVSLRWPQAAAPERVRRVSTTGAEQDLPFTWSGGQVNVDVPFSGLAGESAGSGLSYVTVYVAADPPPVQPLSRVGDAGDHADGQMVSLSAKTVSRAFSGFFYVQDSAEPGAPGIKVAATKSVIPGNLATVYGVLETVDGERQVRATSSGVAVEGTGLPAPCPVGLSVRSSRCAGSGGSPGTSTSGGAYNTGILARLFGRVSSVETGSFLLSDGSDAPVTVKVQGSVAIVSGDFVVVTGVLGSELQSGTPARIVRALAKDVEVCSQAEGQ